MVPPKSCWGQEWATTKSSLAWPVDTELFFPTGRGQLLLTLQSTLLQVVTQDAIKHLRASLVFLNAFPNAILTNTFIRDSLIIAAKKRCPEASSIHRRLLHDGDYISKISPLVSFPFVKDYKTDIYSKLRARIPLFRREVKEICNTIALAEFSSMASADIVSTASAWQRSNYNYIYPKAPKVSDASVIVTRDHLTVS